jgi:hypothetical protein
MKHTSRHNRLAVQFATADSLEWQLTRYRVATPLLRLSSAPARTEVKSIK